MKRTLIFLLLGTCMQLSHAQHFSDLGNYTSFQGFFDFYYDNDMDKIYMVVENPGEEFLYIHALSSGVGSNDLGLDRGQIGGQKVVHFRKAGKKMLLVQPNLDYRAESDNDLEIQAVEEAFARSVIYSFPILDESNGRFLVDVENMLLSDAHHIMESLALQQQGQYTLDLQRSALEMGRTRAFPDNVEFDAMLTFSGQPVRGYLNQVTPDSHHVTVNQHHSFVRLPDDEYRARAFHPGSGCISISYMDYATPVHESIRKQFIIRHRLEKKNPEQAVSEAVEPIVYYLDNGTPEPVRSALLEGASWWDEAFRALGFENAFRVEILPEDADPLDVRYNVIQWVHRATRGWSYGNAVIDPRTGEIIKGHVSLGSLRVRQDFLIAQALLDRPYTESDDKTPEMMGLALARIRQLSVHEIGHTLGFVHNYAASSTGNSSVMDYPHPMVYVEDGEVKLDRAYTRGLGAWDKVTVAYAYTPFENKEAEEKGLEKILTDAAEAGLTYITDYDARATGGAHPDAHLWDNGTSALKELANVLEVRQTAIKHFSVDNIPGGQPVSILEDVFVPLYFFHRYQVEAAVKLVGGMQYSYQVKGDGSEPARPLSGEIQEEAMKLLIHCLDPGILAVPEEKLELFPPRVPGYYRSRESFQHMTGVTFDYLGPVTASANTTLELLLYPERANRLVQQHARDKSLPGLQSLLLELVKKQFASMGKEEDGYMAEVAHSIRFMVIGHMIRLKNDPGVYPQVSAITGDVLSGLANWIEKGDFKGTDRTYSKAYLEQIRSGKGIEPETLPGIPPGSPIGMETMPF